MNYLEVAANLSEVFTASVAVVGYGLFKIDQQRKKCALEKYLKTEKKSTTNEGQHSVLHLMAKLGLTETEILQASFRSKSINRLIAKDPKTNRAEALLLEYRE